MRRPGRARWPDLAAGNARRDARAGPDVLGERLSQPVEGGPVAAAQRAAAFLGRQLPFTGSALLGFGAIAVGLLLAGAGLLASRRRV